MSNERKFNEEKLLRYKETEDQLLFEEILNEQDIKNYVSYVCNQKLKNFPSTLLSFDDFKNIADLILWQCILKYKFICPVCGIKTKTGSMYKLHMSTKHETYDEPLVSISKYIKFNLGAYLQNELRKEYSVDRQSNLSTISLFVPTFDNSSEHDNDNSNTLEYEIQDEASIEDKFIFDDCMEILMNSFDSVTKEIFHSIYILDMTPTEVAIKLFEEGRYTSEQSAKVIISRTLNSKIRPAIKEFYTKYQ